MDTVGQIPVEHHLVPDGVLVVLIALLMGLAIAVRLVIVAAVAMVSLGRRKTQAAGPGSRSA